MDLVPVLDEPLKKALGAATAKVMAEHLGLHTVGDLLHHYPRRYEERGQLTHLADLPLDEHVTVVAQVADARLHTFASSKAPRGKGQRLEVTITDGSGRLQLVFFGHGVHKPHKELLPGTRAMFSGKVSVFNRRLQLAHPAYELLTGDGDEAVESVDSWAGALIPIYPATAKLESWKIAKSVQTVLPSAQEAVDPLPDSLRDGRGLVTLPEALLKIHRPHTKADVEDARARLKWDEAFVLQVALARRRHADAQLPAVARVPAPDGLLTAFDAKLPFTLTEGQQKVSKEIFDGLATEHPMHRLLQGEVGSGKTMVALRAMLAVVDAGGQAAMLAPTEVLAQQHHRSITEMMGELAEGGMLGGAEHSTKVVLLTGSMGTAGRRQALLDLVTGEAGLVIGTHALIEDKVQFHDLGLVVVDEQHRFGVEQRDALRGKGKQPPHLLVMTATPIPRTVAMTVFGDLETSVLDQLPAGRSPIASHVVPAADKPHFLARAWERVREEVENGHQAYVVCPRIGDEDDDPKKGRKKASPEDDAEKRPPLAVLDVAAQLAKGPLQGLRIEVLHGRMHPDDKDAVMRRFAAGETDVLVATTVIEVGVNVPNATAMVIMDADRFGVSQLHQLRGRVGRGSAAGLCLLVSEMPEASPARQRLTAVASTLDGFELSRIDLEQRREGDVLGQAQSGVRSSLRMLAVIEDEEIIAEAREEATAVVAADPELTGLPGLRTALDALLDEEREQYLDKG
ncbi:MULTISPECIES: ATP-dependent DNA helicase RecG [unclassified Streptomyces]|uniref:ATP-dependent DNA helicase RecG n=1 Tax=unclassified Streptomyces TaxID=2593676 RepID=UPI0013BE1BF0|nr:MULTISPECIES: ATP-dependent DNA helicase RecG [unclassified Streptomyces]MCX4917285.1 ATP-dependent DNA helicase RecG [Streptomyces sp. NBC_00687]MCX5130612.1 ATP-dependent DNA helicase RecG [Streptomyces sp. NBC_00340]MCX5279364.1 ATP-dependent DNA helicase RecG [Streptomyces sp. NBC_00198]NEB34080.1 ATP-dependent DNA helicase RecG [Streptomyces sp. SID14446]WSD77337.1 ATP-dependent DNA helicase RecG [Streptomyces sp. NBC_01558]